MSMGRDKNRHQGFFRLAAEQNANSQLAHARLPVAGWVFSTNFREIEAGLRADWFRSRLRLVHTHVALHTP